MTVPRFGESIEPAHHRLDRSNYESVFVIGDVHGCIAELRQLWGRLDPGPDDLVIFVGDLIRKGPASDAVIEFVRTRENALSIRGNNEEMVVRGDVSSELSARNRRALESFPFVVSWGDTIVVHGGVAPGRPLDEHGPTDILEMRARPQANGYDGPFWFETYTGPPRVYFGHTVMKQPLIEEWCIGLDTGCVHGGRLTAFDCGNQSVVSVPAERTYVSRSADRIVEV